MRRLTVGGAEMVVLADEAAVAREAASRTSAALGEALHARGTAHLALTGGSAAVPLYRELARPPWRDAIRWDEVHFWWGDDRFVPRDHPESNAGLAYRTLFEPAALAAVDSEKIHPIRTDEAIANSSGPAWAAQDYAAQIEHEVPPGPETLPTFDVILLGVGPDGHTLSVFPGSAALAADAPLVMAIDAPDHVEPHLPRVTLAARVLPAAGSVIVMSSGASKADVLAEVLVGPRDVTRWPAQAAILPNATWLLDEAAAARLARPGQAPAGQTPRVTTK